MNFLKARRTFFAVNFSPSWTAIMLSILEIPSKRETLKVYKPDDVFTPLLHLFFVLYIVSFVSSIFLFLLSSSCRALCNFCFGKCFRLLVIDCYTTHRITLREINTENAPYVPTRALNKISTYIFRAWASKFRDLNCSHTWGKGASRRFDSVRWWV